LPISQDTVVPYAGGPGPSGRITFLGAQGSFERWAELNGCTAATVEDGGCTYYKECDAGVEVGLCVAQGGGHAAGDADVGWEFLSRFTLPCRLKTPRHAARAPEGRTTWSMADPPTGGR